MNIIKRVDALKLDALVDIIQNWPDIQTKYRNESIVQVAKTFKANMDRTHGMLAMWNYLTGQSVVATQAASLAAFWATNGRTCIWWDATDPDGTTPLQEHIAAKKFSKAMKYVRRWIKKDPKAEKAQASRIWKALLQNGPGKILTGLESSLGASLIATWTAFEVLAGDLWEAVVNSHPGGLAKLQGTWPAEAQYQQKKLKKAKDAAAALKDAGDSQKSEGKLIKLDFLDQHDYDVSGIMGTIWRRERFNFQILSSIRDAYIQAFYCDHDDIRSAILSLDISAVAAVRNVLVHNAGYADAQFLDALQGTDIFSDAKLDKPLLITGKHVGHLVRATTLVAYRLLSAADDWLKSHPVKWHAKSTKK